MRNAFRIAGFGLAAGAAVMIAAAGAASPRGPNGVGGLFGGADVFGAGPRGGLFAVQFADLDTDGDGFVTEAELTARAQALAADRLAGVDTDGDGVLSADELEAGLVARIEARTEGRVRPGLAAVDPADRAKAMVARLLSVHDTDANGVLSGEEVSPAAGIATLVDRFDTDDDNAWTPEEFAAVSFGRAWVDDGVGDFRRGHGGWDGKRR